MIPNSSCNLLKAILKRMMQLSILFVVYFSKIYFVVDEIVVSKVANELAQQEHLLSALEAAQCR